MCAVIRRRFPVGASPTRRRINHALVMADRERVGRDASPSAAIIDSQRVKTTEAGGPRGYDAGKKVNGRKRHALVDTDGRGLALEPHPASLPLSGRRLAPSTRCGFPVGNSATAKGDRPDQAVAANKSNRGAARVTRKTNQRVARRQMEASFARAPD